MSPQDLEELRTSLRSTALQAAEEAFFPEGLGFFPGGLETKALYGIWEDDNSQKEKEWRGEEVEETIREVWRELCKAWPFFQYIRPENRPPSCSTS